MKASLVGKWIGLALSCSVLSGCNRDSEPAQAPAASQTAKSASSVSADPLAGMVKAVTSDTRHQFIELRFDLSAKPQVGEAVDIKLALRAADDLADVKLTLSADPKLAIIAGGDAAFAAIKAGEIVTHTVTLRPTGTGIIVMDANLALTANGGPRTLNYAIPVAVIGATAQSSASATATATTAEHK